MEKKALKVPGSPRRRRGGGWIFFGACLLLLFLDFFVPKHGKFYWEKAPNFFAAFGFVSCVALALGAKLLGRILRRDEGYYGP